MGYYAVKHQCDHTCAECKWYWFDKEWVDHCKKGRDYRVGWGVLACKDYAPDDGENSEEE